MRGQSLIEVVIAFGIGTLMVVTASTGAALVLRTTEISDKNQIALASGNALAENLHSFTEANWLNIYNLNKSSANKYFLATTTGTLVAQSGEEALTMGGTEFKRHFFIENVCRSASGNITTVSPCNGGDKDDPSTQKATIAASYVIGDTTNAITETIYLTRWRNAVFQQTDWSGGSGQEGPIIIVNNRFSSQQNLDFTSASGSVKVAAGMGECGDDFFPDCELTSSTFDTQVSGGVALNTIMWQGSQPAGTKVKFEIATSNSPTGPWPFNGGPLKPTGPNVQVPIDLELHNNKRYFRYKILIEGSGSNSPRIDDLIISWSP